MSESNIAKRYARALYELAEKSGQSEVVSKQLESLVAAWKSSEPLQQLFENPVVDRALQKKVLEALSLKLGFATDLKNTLYLLADRKRVHLVLDISEQFQKIVQRKQGVEFAEVTTAKPMSPEYYNQLQATLEQVVGKKVVLTKKEDASLLAGAIARMGDQVFDGSLRNQIENMKQQILTSP